MFNDLFQFGGLESICTGILDEFPKLRRNRKLFVLGLMVYCFLGALSTITYVSFFFISVPEIRLL